MRSQLTFVFWTILAVLFAVAPTLVPGALAQGAGATPKYKVLHSFTGTDGSGPWAGVTLDPTGTIYGTTAGGGTGSACTGGCGTVFRLIRQTDGDWTETVLHSFDANGDGSDLLGRLIFDAAGNAYSKRS